MYLIIEGIDPEQFGTNAYIQTSYYDTPINCHNNDLILAGSTQISYITEEAIQDTSSMISDILIVEESEYICEVYVVNDYVYYTISDDYNDANLYRIKVDSTDWKDV